MPLAAVLTLLSALGLQLAMVVGVLQPSLFLAVLGYAGLFAGMALILPAALRRAQRPGKHDGTGHPGRPRAAESVTAKAMTQDPMSTRPP